MSGARRPQGTEMFPGLILLAYLALLACKPSHKPLYKPVCQKLIKEGCNFNNNYYCVAAYVTTHVASYAIGYRGG